MSFALFAAGCAGSTPSERTDEETLVGEPPSEREEPYRSVDTDEAETADTSGYIDESSAESPSSPTDGEADSEGASGSEYRCFACVRLCPDQTPTRADETCRPDDHDVICGWGVHPERTTAEKLARAECNGALDLARHSPEWSRIAGECPAATCRQAARENE